MSSARSFVDRSVGVCSLVLAVVMPASTVGAQDVLPQPPDPFEGKIGLSVHDSEPDFPEGVHAPEGAPNVLLVMLDDVGFGASSAFGGPCNTPTLERLAASGLRYNQFHTTALCSPTRAALLTGRNHHSAHTACIMEAGTGFPGYDTVMQKDTATMAEVLKQTGWNTAWFGKNHNVPDWMTSQAGPFDLWPVGLGFEKFYGFIGGDTNQWRAAVTDGTKPIDPYVDDPDYNFDYDLADQAIAWVRSQKVVAPDKPFFLYYVPGATHAPHHPRQEWVEKYAGKFDKGWDAVREETYARQKELGVIPAGCELTPRHAAIQAWDSCSPEEQKLYARFMEVYAGYLEQTDHNVGRVLDAIEELGQLENTLVIYIVGDNGASAEGSLQGLANEMTFFNGVKEDLQELLDGIDEIGSWKTYNHYPVGWAHAMCTPFQWTKQIASHYGGTRNAMVVSWPAGIAARGELRSQWHHVIDVAPTVLEACGVRMPSIVNGVAQKPVEGTSFAYTFEDADADSRRTKQYFEMLGNRAIYHDGWVACTTPPVAPWDPHGAEVDPITGYTWELYHVDEDFSQAHDLAAQEPERLALMQTLFYAEAALYDVLPIDNSKTARLDPSIRPSLTRGRESFTYYDGQTRIPEGALPDVKNKSWRVTAKVTAKGAGDEGTLVTQGGLFGGWALLVQGGKPAFHYNFVGLETTSVAGTQPLAAGDHTIVVDFRYDGKKGEIGKGGTFTLSVDGTTVADAKIARSIPLRIALDEGLDVGVDSGTPVTLDYDVPFRYTGELARVTIDLVGGPVEAGAPK